MTSLLKLEEFTIDIIRCLVDNDRDNVSVEIAKAKDNNWNLYIKFSSMENIETICIPTWKKLEENEDKVAFVKDLIADEELIKLFLKGDLE